MPKTWREINREAREIIGGLEELARKLGDRGDEVMADFYTGKKGYQEALKRL